MLYVCYYNLRFVNMCVIEKWCICGAVYFWQPKSVCVHNIYAADLSIFKKLWHAAIIGAIQHFVNVRNTV